MAHMSKYNRTFLEKLYEHKIRKVYTRIELLDWNEKVLSNIDGIVLNGSYNVDGNSSVRRNVSLTVSVEDRDEKLVFDYLDLSKKIKLFAGLENFTDEHLDEEIIWFDLGTYVLLDPSYTHNTKELRMSLQGQDKMALLNGVIGGSLPTATSFTERNSKTGQTSSLSWREIFYYAATIFGEEDPARVVVDEVPDFIYDYTQVKTVAGLKHDFIHVNAPSDMDGERIITKAWHPEVPEKEVKFSQTDRLYKLRRFGPPDPVESDTGSKEVYMKNAGEPISSIFEDIVQNLSFTHEYFYTTEGNLILQKVQTYINDTFDPDKDPDMGYASYEFNMHDYIPDFSGFPFVYDFTNKESVTAYTNNPAWTNVKNDFVVVGKDGINTLQVAIDKRPTISELRNWFRQFNNEFMDNPFVEELEFLRLDGSIDRMPYNELEDTVPFLYKEATATSAPVYVDVPLSKIPWQVALGLKNFLIRNVYSSIGQERVLPRWGRECESMIFSWKANVDKTSLVSNMGIFNPANAVSGNPWLAGYKTLKAAGGVDEVEKLDYGEPIFTASGDPTFWMYFLDIIDENTQLGKYSIDKIGKRTVVESSEHATTIFRVTPKSLVVITESELEKLGGNTVLEDMRGRGQAYAIIADKTIQTYLRPEYTATETKDEYPYHSIVGDPDKGEKQYFEAPKPTGGVSRFLVGGMWTGSLTPNKDTKGNDAPGSVLITPGKFLHPNGETKRENLMKSQIDFPIGQEENKDEYVFIVSTSGVSGGRFPGAATTDNSFIGAKYVVKEGRWYYSQTSGNTIKWASFNFNTLEKNGDVIVAVASQNIVHSEDITWGSGRIDSIDMLLNMREAELVSLFDSTGAVDCFSKVRELIYNKTNFAEVITLTTLPVYHLEPNTLIRVEDERSNIFGIFMITSFNIPFSISGADLMSINAIKVNQRI